MNSTLNQSTVIARLTVTRQDNTCTIVEIHSDATFHGFYHFFKQQGRRRSTKQPTRTASRNESLPVINAHLHKPGLNVIEKRLKEFGAQSNPVISSKIRIIKKRIYKKLITASPDALGLSKISKTFIDVVQPKKILLHPRVIGRAIPAGKWLQSLQGAKP